MRRAAATRSEAASPRDSSSTLYIDDAEVTICARNARTAFDHALAADIPTVELLVEHFGGDDETWVKEGGVVVYSQSSAERPAP